MRTPCRPTYLPELLITRINQRKSIKCVLWLGLYITNYSVSSAFASEINDCKNQEREEGIWNVLETSYMSNTPV
jgi:hypothetical protein